MMHSELPDPFRDAYSDLITSLGDRADYGGLQARQLEMVLNDPDLLPEIDRRLVVLNALVLGGRAREAYALGSALLRGSSSDATWLPIVITAAIEIGEHSLALPYVERLSQIGGTGFLELLTALACAKVEEARYSEAADFLALILQLTERSGIMVPVGILQRLRLWATCCVRCHLPVLDANTGTLEMPEELRARCLAGFELELARMDALFSGLGYLRRALAQSLKGWRDTVLMDELAANAALRMRLDQMIETLAASDEGPVSVFQPMAVTISPGDAGSSLA